MLPSPRSSVTPWPTVQQGVSLDDALTAFVERCVGPSANEEAAANALSRVAEYLAGANELAAAMMRLPGADPHGFRWELLYLCESHPEHIHALVRSLPALADSHWGGTALVRVLLTADSEQDDVNVLLEALERADEAQRTAAAAALRELAADTEELDPAARAALERAAQVVGSPSGA